MKGTLLPISLGLAGLALLVWLVWGLFATQRADVATARAFLTEIAEGRHEAAEARMTGALVQRVGPGGLGRLFGPVEPWTRLGFTARETDHSGGTRRTDLRGTGRTPSGCESRLRLTLIDGLVDAFDVTPLCPAVEVAA